MSCEKPSPGMEVSRRDFLKLCAAAAPVSLLLATAKSTVFKFAVAPAKEYAEKAKLKLKAGKEVVSVCTYCGCGCGIIARVVDGKCVNTEGDPLNPINEGALCPKGLSVRQYLGKEGNPFSPANPWRLRYPKIRGNPEKGVHVDPMWKPITWGDALTIIGKKVVKELDAFFKTLKEKTGAYYFDGHDNPVGFIGSAKYNTDEAFLNRKISMMFGTNNIDHCARKCHASTVAGAAFTFGFGAQSQTFRDIVLSKRIILCGGNPASAHPMAWRWIIKAKDRGAKVIVVDPRFCRSAALADIYVPVRACSDVAFFLGLINYAIQHKKYDEEYLKRRTNAPFLLDVSGYPYKIVYVVSTADKDFAGLPNAWKGVKVPAVVDARDGKIKPWCEVPPEYRKLEYEGTFEGKPVKTVFTVLKEVASNYTIEEVSRITGAPKERLAKAYEMYCEDRPSTVFWAMGLTQHTHGTQLIRSVCIAQLVLGNVGRPGGGINPLRGQDNVQGATDMCVLAHIYPGYIAPPTNFDQIREYQAWKNAGMPLDTDKEIKPIRTFTWKGKKYEKGKTYPNPWYLQTLKIRLFKGWRLFERTWGLFVGTWPLEDPEKGTVISDLPFNVGHPTIDFGRAFGHGAIRVWIINGDNPVISDAGGCGCAEEITNYKFNVADPANSEKLLVVMETWESETAHLADIVLPAANFMEKSGPVTNSNRWTQWRYKVQDPPGEAKPDIWFFTKLWKKVRELGYKMPSERFMEDHPGEKYLTLDEVIDKVPEVIRKYIKGTKFMEFISPDEVKHKILADIVPRPCPDWSWDWYDEVVDEDQEEASVRATVEIDDAVALYNGLYAHEDLEDPDAARSAVIAYMKTKDRSRLLPMRRKRAVFMGKKLSEMTPEDIDKVEAAIKAGNKEAYWFLVAKEWSWCWPRNQRVLYYSGDPGELDDVAVKGINATPAFWPKDPENPKPSEFWKYYFYKYEQTFYLGKDRSGLATIWQQKHADYAAKAEEKYKAWKGTYLVGRKWKGPGGKWVGGIPEHAEPLESPDPELAKDYPSMAWLYIKPESPYEANDKLEEWDMIGTPEEGYTVVLGTFRPTEHYHIHTRILPWLVECQPELWAEVPVGLAKELGITTGDWIIVESKRCAIAVKALVTSRIGQLMINGKPVYQVMMPFHWGYKGISVGSPTNWVTMPAVDPFAKIPETKACLVKVRKPTSEELAEIERNAMLARAKFQKALTNGAEFDKLFEEFAKKYGAKLIGSYLMKPKHTGPTHH